MREHMEPIRIAVLTEAGSSESQTALTLSVLQATADEVRKKADIEIYLIGRSCMGIEGLECEGVHRGERWNTALAELRETDAEAVLFLEPDTLIDAKMLETYISFLDTGYGGLSIYDHYVMDSESDRCVFWNGHTGVKRNTPIANGRCLSRRWLDEVRWAVMDPVSDELTEGMKAKWLELICQAAHAGESRVFGSIASQLGLATFQAAGLDFFEQAGDSANTHPIQRSVFLERHYGDLAEIILSGEVPDLSFDEPAYSIENDVESVSADDAALATAPINSEAEHIEQPDPDDDLVEAEAQPAVALDEVLAPLGSREDGEQELSDSSEPSVSVAEIVSSAAPEIATIPGESTPIEAPSMTLKRRPIEGVTLDAGADVPPKSVSDEVPAITLKRRPIEGISLRSGDETSARAEESTPIKLTRRSIDEGDGHSTPGAAIEAEGADLAPPRSSIALSDGPDPQTPEDWVARGESAFSEGDLDHAERCFRQALMLNPIYSPALNDLAVVHHQRGQANEAERLYLKAVTFDTDQADAFVGLIGLSASTGQTGLAIRYAARGLKRAPEHPELLQVVNTLTESAGGVSAQRKGA